MSPEVFSQQAEALSEPFTEIVFKTANDCNMRPQHELDRDPLALVTPGCDHCYMYTHSTLWQQEPEFMEPHVAEQGLRRIAEHAEEHRLPHVRLITHGGEPLLALRKHPQYYAEFAKMAHHYLDPVGTQTHLFIQTNGLLLNTRGGPAIVEQLNKAVFTIGLSSDGPQIANDLHRRDRAGRSIHTRAERAARLLNEAGANWGILGVIDPRTNPEEVVEYLASLSPSTINLFPLHANHSAPPVSHPGAISLGEWQKRAFDRYNNWHRYHPDQAGPPFTMPIYDNYLQIGFGGGSVNDTAGARVTQELFITPGGNWERLDTLKSADDGAVTTGLNIFEHSLDDVREDPGIIARRLGFSVLAPECQGCEVRAMCWGGHYPNRFKAGDRPLSPQSSVDEFVEAFRNPSAHCADHKIFIGYLDKLIKSVPQPVVANIDVPNNPGVLVEADAVQLQAFGNRAIQQRTKRLQSLSDLPLAEDLLSHTGNFQNFPWQQHLTEFKLALNEADALLEATQTERLIGREALLAASTAAYMKLSSGRILYAGDITDRLPNRDDMVMLSQDYNDAIVNGLLDVKQPFLKGTEAWVRRKSQGYWLITQSIANCVFNQQDTARGYVSLLSVPSDLQETSFIGAEYGIDATTAGDPILSLPITVTAHDLPGDILVVNTPSGIEDDSIALLEHVASALPNYQNPEQLARTLEADGHGSITPLWGSWPSEYAGLEWKSRSPATLPFGQLTKLEKLARMAIAVPVSTRQERVGHSQLQGSELTTPYLANRFYEGPYGTAEDIGALGLHSSMRPAGV